MRTAAWSGRSFLAGVATTLAALGVLAAGTFLLCKGGDEFAISRELASPNGQQRAILYTGMGGGAAGWCYQRVAVAPAGAAFDPEHPAVGLPGYVFSVGCGSRVALEWETDARLRVSYSVGSGTSVTLFPRTEDGKVALTYAVRE